MNTQPFYDVLEATGYFVNGAPAPTVTLGHDDHNAPRRRNFEPDATWCGRSSLTVYFKCAPSSPSADTVAQWRQEIWNEGTAPLLWVVRPDKIDIYNGFAEPKGPGDAEASRLRTFDYTTSDLEELDRAAGRLAMETDRFWQHGMARKVNRRTSVDSLLLRDIKRLEKDLSNGGMARLDAQGLIGRMVFAQYLVDREIVTKNFLANLADSPKLSQALRNRVMAERLFDWLRDVFNGDMFTSTGTFAEAGHLKRVADFLDAVDPGTGQTTLFPYQFDIIPVELISSIYEQFVRTEEPTAGSDDAKDVHYTRLSLVSLVLDEAMNECSGDETVLDLTCGSGVFLVEALRRLVRKRARDQKPTRKLIRDVLYGQVFGSDISKAAIQVAAFSLYLTALELDPQPEPPENLTFKRLIGRTLHTGDVWKDGPDLDRQTDGRKFDVIVGNPPWSKAGGSWAHSLDFVDRAMDYASESTRFGLVLAARHFFGRTPRTRQTLRRLLSRLAPVTLVNLSNLKGWLFEGVDMPAIVLFARQRKWVGNPNEIAAYQVPWTAAGKDSHTFQVGYSNRVTIPLDYWTDRPECLKAVLFGGRYDADLLRRLNERYRPLDEALTRLGTKFWRGLTATNSKGQDAKFLNGLPFLEAVSGLKPYSVPAELSPFSSPFARRSRSRSVYSAPLLLLKEGANAEHEGRLTATVADEDVVFSQSFYGAPVGEAHRDAAWLMAGILGSSLASWFFLMAAQDFGLWISRVTLADVNQLPVPDVEAALASQPGQRVVALAQAGPVKEDEWHLLDQAVLDLYDLHADDRVAVRDGLIRAGWQWRAGRDRSVAAAVPDVHVRRYASVFMSVIYRLQQAGKKNCIRAEVYDLPEGEAVRVVRFVLEPGYRRPRSEVVPPSGGLQKLLGRIGAGLNVSSTDLATADEVQRYGDEEIVVVKPAAVRHWMDVCAMRDAGRAVADSMGGWRP